MLHHLKTFAAVFAVTAGLGTVATVAQGAIIPAGLYGFNPETMDLLRVDPTTSTTSLFAPGVVANSNLNLTFNPNTGLFHQITNPGDELISIDGGGGSAIIGSLAASAYLALTYDPNADTLYTTQVGGGNTLLSVDPLTAAATTIGTLGLSSGLGGLAFDAGTNTLYGILPGGDLHTIDITTGTATLVGGIMLGFSTTTASLAYDPFVDVLYSFDTPESVN